jgi:hypothetical protein
MSFRSAVLIPPLLTGAYVYRDNTVIMAISDLLV